METRASHVLIGAFMIALMAALFGFIIWLARVDASRTNDYDVFFTGSVAGLVQGGTVNYNGVPVGTVREIALVPNKPSLVRVRIRVSRDTPVFKGTTAVLEAQGLTGAVFVQLSGAMTAGTPLREVGPYGVPVIPSRPSPLQELFVSAPELLKRATDVVEQVDKLLNPENQRAFGRILANSEQLTGSLAKAGPDLEAALRQLNLTLADARGAVGSINGLARDADTLVNQDARPAVDDLRKTLARTQALLANIDAAITENRPGLARFTNNTLGDTGKLIGDLRELSRSITRLTDRIDQGSAASLFLGEKAPVYDGK